jgi:benzoyl-CoA reductase/2-hydroxyglutaryl-CoA dehydratase subunit BcrC/BadD/HgdB
MLRMKTVLYSSPFVPAEWLATHRVRPVRIRPDPQAARRVAGSLAGMCPYARAFMGEALAPVGPDAVIVTTTCDQMRRAAEWLSMSGDRPVFLMNVPATWQTPVAARLYRLELERLARFLVHIGGRAPDPAYLVEVMEFYDARRAALRDAAGRLSSREVSEAASRFDLGEFILPTTRPGAAVPRRTAVALVGGPLMRGDDRIFQAVEEGGGTVVLDGTESGWRTRPASFDRRRLRGDPLMELVDAYFGAIPDVFRRPDTLWHEWLRREVPASGARGVIVWRYVWCDLWAAAAAVIRQATDLPVLQLDVPGDESEFEQVRNRIQAFLEVLQ